MEFKKRLTLLMLGCLVLSGAVLARAVAIQVVRDPRLEKMAKRQFQSKVLLRPRRGDILDRNGEALAVNVETSSLAANPSKIKNRRTMARLLAKATDIPYEKLASRLNGKKEFIWIKRHIPEAELEQYKKWQIIGADGDLIDGLWLVKESKRVYPHHELASQILGSVNVDSQGLEGVELWLDEGLKGKVVSVDATKDALGRPTFMDAVAARNVSDGESVTLTIDASLQFGVEQELKHAIEKSHARGGSVIIMNAVNGEILAMANEPSFDPNLSGSPVANRRNRSVTDGYEPGSTLKSVLLSIALNKGQKLSDQLFAGNGSFTVQGKKISEAEVHEKFSWITLNKMLQVSSNVGAAKLALKVGGETYQKGLESFGFGTRTQIGFPGEIAGKLPAKKTWSPLTVANVGFGQGVLVTPIQMTRAYATFLNGGWLVQPTILKNSPAKFKPVAPKRIISRAAADGTVEALSAVTQKDGTGIKAVLDGYEVAGKTGTAQTVDPVTGAYSRSRFIASFIGFAPSVEPKLVIYTAIDGPQGIYYASETAAPLFKNVLQLTVNRFSIPSNPKLMAPVLAEKRQSDELHMQASQVNPVAAQDGIADVDAPELPLKWVGSSADGAALWQMPSLVGLTPREALRALQGHRLQVEMTGSGLVSRQIPEAGKPLAEGTTVKMNLSEL